MPEKHQKISKLIKKVSKIKFSPLCKYKELVGKLQHASFGITGGKGLFSPIYQALKITASNIPITEHLKADLVNFRTIVNHLSTNTNPVQLMIREYPNYNQYTKSCK